ncbi:MAG: hypothetical protein ACK5SP_02245 [bacterium]|jgi:hypothetical protein
MTATQQEMFDYLNALRDSGATNMFLAAPYLQSAFGIDRREAKEVLFAWMKHVTQQGARA